MRISWSDAGKAGGGRPPNWAGKRRKPKLMKPTEQFSLTGRDGHPLRAYSWLPEDKESIRGIVQIAHGLAEHALRYGRLAQALNENGFAVYANDHRGHGKTAELPEDLGFFANQDGWSLLIHDMYLLHQHAAEAHPGQPLFLLGHSMGSFLSQEFIAEYGSKLKGAVLSASVDSAGPIRPVGVAVAKVERWRLGSKGRSPLLHAMSFGDYNKPFAPTRTEYDWLSRDPAEVDKYVEDPLCGQPSTTQLWIDLLEGLGRISSTTMRKKVPKDLPLYLLTGTQDPVTQNGKGLERLAKAYRSAGVKDVTVKQYPNARHECFNETNREEVTADLITWLDSLY